jgi:hypothetical protein
MPIPEIGAKLDTTKLVRKQHPEYLTRSREYRFLYDCYSGSGGFSSELLRYKIIDKGLEAAVDTGALTYLEPHGAESVVKFRNRVLRSYYRNLAKEKIVDPLVGFLTKRTPDRSEYPEMLKAWLEDVGDGNGWDLWLETTGIPWMLVYGHLPVLVTNDPHNAETKLQQEQAGAKEARLVEIHPGNIWDWQWTGDGLNYKWLKYVEPFEKSEPMGTSTVSWLRVVWLTEEGWWYVEIPEGETVTRLSEYPVIDADVWPPEIQALGRPPVAELRNGDTRISVLNNLSGMLKRSFNLDSERDEILRGQTFATLVLFTRGGKKELDRVKLGTDNALCADPDTTNKPYYLSPDSSSADIYEKAIAQLGADILDQANMATEQSGGQMAAATAAFKFQQTDRKIALIAGNLERGEYDFLNIVATWKRTELPTDARARWPYTYDAVDKERENQAASDILSHDVGPTAQRLILLKAIKANLPNESEETYDQIDKELEEIGEDEQGADETAEQEAARLQAELDNEARKPDAPEIPEQGENP